MDASGSNRNQERDRRSSSRYPDERPAAAILLVEDNRADVYLIREAISAFNVPAELYIVSDGSKAIKFIDEADRDESLPCPRLVLLDLNLPKVPGTEVLAHLRHSRRCSKARAIIVTSSDSQGDRTTAAALGADAYFRKPSVYEDFIKLGELVKASLESGEHAG